MAIELSLTKTRMPNNTTRTSRVNVLVPKNAKLQGSMSLPQKGRRILFEHIKHEEQTCRGALLKKCWPQNTNTEESYPEMALKIKDGVLGKD